MTDPRVPLKNPFLAVLLGLVMPGGGQLYQGRTFKGVLYAVCIIGTFTYGMFLSDWTALYAGSPLSSTGRRWGYLAQTPIGVPAAYALVQQKRYSSPENTSQYAIDQPLSAPFEGIVRLGNGDEGVAWPEAFKALEEARKQAIQKGQGAAVDGEVSEPEYQYYRLKGEVELRPISTNIGPQVEGRFTGHINLWNAETKTYDETGDAVELPLSSEVGRFEIDRKIYADRQRSLKIPIVGEGDDGRPHKAGVLRGTIPRPIGNWLAVPLEPEKLNRLHYELGKTYDLALVYTWIAALLNVLVLWDAFEGPAYGYGDEKPEGDADGNKPEKEPAPAV
jgi:hypothetical protein